MAKRNPTRWQTRFGGWVSSYTVSNLTHALAKRGQTVTPQAVYGWISGRAAPRPPEAIAIVELSAGTLTLDDVYGHARHVRSSSAEVARRS